MKSKNICMFIVSSTLMLCHAVNAQPICDKVGTQQLENINVAVKSAINNFNDKNTDLVYSFIDENRYIQHVPNGVDGGAGLIKFIDFMKTNMPTFNVKNIRSVAENDIVLTQSVDFLKGKPIEVSYDWYRVNDGKITEHWDVVSEYPKDINTSIYTSGPKVNADVCLQKEKIRSIALEYFYTTWGQLDTKAIIKHVSDNFVQHNPYAITHGKSDKKALIDIVSELKTSGYNAHIEISKVIVMDDFAAIHAKWTDGKEVLSITDMLRFDTDYKIVEHWDGQKAIPTSNSNKRDAVF
ncbi:nuclear transport factor 2 family protein [Aeromonas sp. EERV15]|uniref:nuclear transport factor 2 family protein n=1 Tax=Aeromonas sp. EERV15 TaxID=1833892 RepID=UPI00083AF916|nr:nuclear transport factor 2 family protein [Aeromonas sp. EERV15]